MMIQPKNDTKEMTNVNTNNMRKAKDQLCIRTDVFVISWQRQFVIMIRPQEKKF